WLERFRSPLKTYRCPVSISSMALWHMLAHGRVFAAGRRTHVDRDAIAAMEQLDGTRGDPRPQRLAQQPMRHRVVVLLDLDVIIEAGLALLPFGVDVRCRRERLQSWSISRVEPRPAAHAQMRGRAVVQ